MERGPLAVGHAIAALLAARVNPDDHTAGDRRCGEHDRHADRGVAQEERVHHQKPAERQEKYAMTSGQWYHQPVGALLNVRDADPAVRAVDQEDNQ